MMLSFRYYSNLLEEFVLIEADFDSAPPDYGNKFSDWDSIGGVYLTYYEAYYEEDNFLVKFVDKKEQKLFHEEVKYYLCQQLKLVEIENQMTSEIDLDEGCYKVYDSWELGEALPYTRGYIG